VDFARLKTFLKVQNITNNCLHVKDNTKESLNSIKSNAKTFAMYAEIKPTTIAVPVAQS
jgi:hypothetical protein